jgi:hypothetical protein
VDDKISQTTGGCFVLGVGVVMEAQVLRQTSSATEEKSRGNRMTIVCGRLASNSVGSLDFADWQPSQISSADASSGFSLT